MIQERLTKKDEPGKLQNICDKIYDKFGGIPFALQNIIGQINIDATEVDELIDRAIHDGNFNNSDNLFTDLKNTIRRNYGEFNWRAWY
ncbi:hypothetical protein NIES2101_40040 [Calothrix sp. HK-06]|nr:hypothetical protein NIES2101_40040 [Calothrix sp. HK-06]